MTDLEGWHIHLISTHKVTHFQSLTMRNVPVTKDKTHARCFYLYLQAEQQPITVQPSVACVQVHISECQGWIRQSRPSTTGSNVEAHVHTHSSMLAGSPLSEPIPHHPFCSTTFFFVFAKDKCLCCFRVPEEPFPGCMCNPCCASNTVVRAALPWGGAETEREAR